MFKELLRGALVLFFGAPIAFPTDVEDVLCDHKVPYEVVAELPDDSGFGAYYRFSDGKIFFDDDIIGSSGYLYRYYAAHEMIHKIRYENGLWTGDRVFEEYVAVYGAEEFSSAIGFGMVSISEQDHIKQTLKKNGLVANEIDIKRVREEIKKTLRVLKDVKN